MPGFAIANPTYQPAMRLVSDITIGNNPTITTTIDHEYLVGLIVRLYVPALFGMIQVDQVTGSITSVPTSSSFILSIDTSGFDTFVVPDPEPWYLNKYALVVPIGEDNSFLTQAVRNVL